MMVHVFRSYPAGSGRALGTYILDLKHENAGERLGPYISDPEKHKVEWSRTVNTNADTPSAAIAAIEQYNAQNLRWHKVSRMVHFVISFPQGEKPTREQADLIEDRLMASVGYEDHPRISALHRPDGQLVDNWHIHVAVSRIDPTTLKAEHPRHNHFSLQAEAGRLELDLGLRQERKTVLPRERREIDARLALQKAIAREASNQEGESDMAETHDPWKATQRGRDPFEPDRSQQSAFIDRSAELPQSGATRESRGTDRQRGHAPATPADALYARYKTEHAIALGHRKEAEQEIYDRFASYQAEQRSFYNLRHEQEKLPARRGIEKHNAHEVLKAERQGDRVQMQQQRSRELATARREYPLPTWSSFLERQSQRGDKEAQRLLTQSRENERGNSLER